MRRLLLGSVTAGCLLTSIACGSSSRESTPSTVADASDSAPQPAASPSDQFRELTVTRGTTLSLTLDQTLGSDTSRVDQPVRAHITRPVTVAGSVAIAVGSELKGAVIDAARSQRVKGRAHLAIRFDEVRLAGENGETYPIRTPEISRTAASQMKTDAMKVGIPAAAGAIVGGIVGGGKGAAIGGAVGGGAGAGYVLSERGPEVSIAAGAPLTVTLLEPITVRVRKHTRQVESATAN